MTFPRAFGIPPRGASALPTPRVQSAAAMRRLPCWIAACLSALAITAHCTCLARAQSLPPNAAAAGTSAVSGGERDAAPTTVLTMAPNGSWGAATDDSVGAAIATAIARCNGRHRHAIGCGAWFTTIRGGWSLGIRCGQESILVSEQTLVEAEQAAIDREVELRRLHAASMPPCIRVVSVDPSGAIIAPYAADLVRIVMHRQDASSR